MRRNWRHISFQIHKVALEIFWVSTLAAPAAVAHVTTRRRAHNHIIRRRRLASFRAAPNADQEFHCIGCSPAERPRRHSIITFQAAPVAERARARRRVVFSETATAQATAVRVQWSLQNGGGDGDGNRRATCRQVVSSRARHSSSRAEPIVATSANVPLCPQNFDACLDGNGTARRRPL